ncbi:SDR family NAD(P)-dependent oxidoreductase [Streptomyces albidoflavus]|uniref:SDR family NAD(P)-dependent oxidoreductase n=1 Tax=Streptomyces albidoflavus TaxID=1886 RepID=UPI0038B25258|nr:type I polyketide synthase [Streptomyces albidoflavus]
MTDQDKLLDYLKRVTADLQQTRQRLREAESGRQEPVAIVAMSCRFPGGAGSPEQLWELLAEGRDAVGELPADRGWDVEALYDPDPGREGTSYVRQGAFVDGVADFDAEFFGISPREALAMDPQQRLLLELSWEAIERAGVDPTSLHGSEVGIFAGTNGQDYPSLLIGSAEGIEGYIGTGNAASTLTGRVSYALGFEGPAVTIDTACSSSLVALHLAAQSLRQGECSLALAGGVTLMATPSLYVEFSRQRGLAADGRCKAFAGAADGTGWGEGAGLLVLERLSDARRNGHEVLAVLRGSAVNQDGASNGLTAPNGPSQRRVIRQALHSAGLTAAQVDAVEAHGTGTKLGDPIEAQALLATYGQGRPGDRPLRLGSVKSNLGHTQAAAGVAGVIKMIMAMRHGLLPRTLHVDEPTPQVDWTAGAVELLTDAHPWPAGDEPRRAGVSSFGISGTNAHVIVEEAPPATAPEEHPPAPATGGAVPWLLSGRTPQALAEQAARLSAHLAERPALRPADVALSLATTRAALEHRAVAVGASPEELRAALDAVAARAPELRTTNGRLALLFTGQGAQRVGMGRELYAAYPVFAEAFDAVCARVDGELGRSLKAVVFEGEGDDDGLLDRTRFTQAALFAVEVAVFRLLESWGVRPDALLGHSVGEIAAAHVAGVLSLDDACTLVAARGRLMDALPEGGAMVAVEATEDEVRAALVDGVSVAAVNGPRAVVVSGEADAVEQVAAALAEQGARTKRLTVSHAFHSALMDPMLDEFRQVAEALTFENARIPVISNLTGETAGPELSTPGYWVRHVREAVRFADGVRTLHAQGVTRFLEAGPDGVLTAMAQNTLPDAGEALFAPLLRKDREESSALLTAVGRLHAHGGEVDWTACLAQTAPGARRVELPTYAFQRSRYWPNVRRPYAEFGAAGVVLAGHPLLGAAVSLADPHGLVLTGRLSLDTHPWLADHAVMGTVIVPGTAFVELAVCAGDQTGRQTVEELTIEAPLVLPAEGGVQVRVTVREGEGDAPAGRRAFTVHSRRDSAEDGEPWTRHASGSLTGTGTEPEPADELAGAWPPPGAEELAVADAYETFAAGGFAYGPAFHGLRAAWRRDGDLFAEVSLPEQERPEAGAFRLHPALLDSALHVVLLAAAQTEAPGRNHGQPASGTRGLPFSWNDIEVRATGATTVRVRISPRPDGVAVTVADETGEPVATVGSLVFREVTADQLAAAEVTAADDAMFRLDWTPCAVEPAPEDTPYALLGEPAGPAEAPATVHALLVDRDPAADDHTAVHAVAGRTLDALRTWLAEPGHADARLVVVTRGAVATGPGSPADLAGAGVWGLVRAAQAENPGRLVLLDLAPGTEADAALTCAAALSGETQLALRGEEWFAPRLARAAAAPTQARPAWSAEDTVLITGGTGALGSLVARHLAAEHGVGALVLTSRSGPAAEGAAALEAELTALGTRVTVAACDAADRDQLAALLAAHPVTAVVHTAGVLDDGVLDTLDADRLAGVLRPKADAALHLDALTRDRDLTAFVLFSSAAGVFGSAGQAAYATANAVLDALAQRRRAAELPGTSLAWGLWEQEGGMTGGLQETDRRRMERSGLRPLRPAEGLALFDRALTTPDDTTGQDGDALLVPMRLDLAAVTAQLRGTPAPPLLRGLVRPVRRREAARGTGAPGTGEAERLSRLAPAERDHAVLTLVRACVADVLGHAGADAVPPRTAFKELGFDSLTAVELRNRLAAATGLRLPATLVFDHPSARELADHLLGRLAESTGQPPAAPARARSRQAAPADEPIAIIGMSCLYPGGVRSPEDLWELVARGGDGITTFPEDRGWDLAALYDPDPENPGTSYTTEGGFLHGAGEFDAELFGISPREALAMDPQQRLLLEASWEAFERAGIAPPDARGSRTGVFAGVMYHDYASRLLAVPEGVEGYLGTGNSGSVASGRVSYTLGLEGPAVTVDTACSSSLVALHLAAQSLRQGECDLALAGGVAVMATPGTFIDFSRQRGLAADGRCKSFAGAADGTGWSEGAGMLLVERLSDARAQGHPVLAVIRGSAVNQDGASNGLTAPNGPAQQRVIRQALENARLAPSEVDAVEAHGTGTTLGDPIEAQALLATYGQDRPEGRPLWLGSVKSNIGHTQAAAGVAGIVKMVEAMRHGVLPKTLHVDEPTPQVDWDEGAVTLLTEEQAWPRPEGRPRRAGVSSFGVSGTNAHVILEQGPDPEPAPRPESPDGTVPWVISGKSPEALRWQASRLLAALTDETPADIGFSLATTRAHLPHRAVAVGDTRAGLLDALSAVAEGRSAAGVVEGVAGEPGRIAFVFPGQGSQWQGMALELLDSSPVFAARMAECGEALSAFTDWSLDDALNGRVDVERVDVVQPLLFAVMVSLAAVWEDWGIRPSAVIGHSQGEIAAACVAGALSLDDAARVVALRSRAIVALAGKGGMVSVPLPVEQVREELAGYEGRVSVAAVNGPASVVVSGDVPGLDELLARWTEAGVRARRVAVDYASHSAHVEELKDELLDVLATIEPQAGRIPVYSTVTGQVEDGSGFDAAYWFANLRQTVEFETATRKLLADGYGVFVESSPHPVVGLGVQETVEDSGTGSGAFTVGSLRRGDGGMDRLLTSLAELHVRGVSPDWAKVFPDTARRVALPTYAFQRTRYWLEPVPAVRGDVSSAGLVAADHPLLGAAVELAQGQGALLTGRLSLETHPWLADHVVAGRVVVPGTALLELALRAGAETGSAVVEELTLETPMVLGASGAIDVQVSVGEREETGRRAVHLHSCPAGAGARSWTRHASGVLRDQLEHEGSGPSAVFGPEAVWPPAGAEPVALENGYDLLASHGVEYGPAFQGLRRLWRRDGELFAEVELPAEVRGEGAAFSVHPALLDAALHALGLGGFVGEAEGPWLPFCWREVALVATGPCALRVRLGRAGSEAAEVELADPSGLPVGRVAALDLRPLALDQLDRLGPNGGADDLFVPTWQPLPAGPPAETGGQGATVRVVDLTGAGNGVPQVHALVAQALRTVREWLADEENAQALLLVVTRGAVAVADGPEDLPAAGVWGLLRSAQAEHPGRFVLLDTDRDLQPAEIPSLAARNEPQIAVRGEQLLVPRLLRPEPGPAAVLPARGAVLVTGGTGVLGGVVARHLVTVHGARRLVLTSRRGLAAEGAEALRDELLGLGAAEVAVVACDMADRDAVAALLDAYPVTAVVHAAGVLDDGVVESVTAERLAAVLRPKVDAALWLHELTVERGIELDAFVLFSSAAGIFGGAGQSAYAAANAVLDGLASHRRARGLAGQSLAWGLWAEASGMTGHLDATALRRLHRNTGALSTEDGLALLDRALAAGAPVLVPMPLDLARTRARSRTEGVPPLLRALVRALPRQAADAAPAPAAEAYASLTPEEVRERMLALVREQAAATLGHQGPGAVEPHRAFKELGFDSLTAVELRNRIAAATGRRLTPTLVFDFPTPEALATHLAAQLAPAPAPAKARPAARAADEPVAIVAMSCRYPGGVDNPDQLWELVAQGADVIGAFPTDRGWPVEQLVEAGASATARGGFLYDAAAFDAGFFGISPREALAMDPQQRLLLETSWEAFERAGLRPDALRGTRTGVFAGVMYQDYATTLGSVPEGAEGYIGTGSSPSVVSGRVAYTFGLEGPAVTVDTACSSSLVALHLAAQALRNGECDMALAGGVTVLATPGLFTEFTRQRGLAADGRCKSFAGAADGSGFSEGAGMILLERLSDARRNGHQVLAVIRGSAVNQDGASNGLTAPNGPAQQRVITQALDAAGLTPADVDAVEAHGTGTTLGDPIEAQALLATYGQGREADRPLRLGSVKSNIGHTQAAAGVAGVIKMVEAMRHGVLPKTLHVDEPTPHVDWTEGAVELLTEPVPWPHEEDRPRRAGVSSFGISGTNAHLIVEEPRDTAPAPADTPATPDAEAPDRPLPWLLSGAGGPALRAQAARLRDHLAHHPSHDARDVAYSLAATRTPFPHRAVLTGTGPELTAALERLAAGDPAPGTATGRADSARGTAFLFPGQGSQRAGAGRELYRSEPVFADRLDEVCAHFDAHLDRPLREVLFAEPGTEDARLLDRTRYTQPALFALGTALFGLLEHWGVRPDALIGHSVGELTAAHAAGVLTLPDACALVAARGRLMDSLPATGAMVAVGAAEEDVRALAAEYGERVAVAAVNGPRSTVVSGDTEAVLRLAERCAAEGHRTKRLTVSHAFHSAHMDAVLAEFGEAAAALTYHPARLPVVSNLTGGVLPPGTPMDAAYWVRHVRESVRFLDGVRALDALGTGTYLELGPDGVLCAMTADCLPESTEEQDRPLAEPLLRSGHDERRTLLTALGRAWSRGTATDWTAVLADPAARPVPLPTYAFQREHYWPRPAPAPATGDVTAAGLSATGHPLFGAAVDLPDGGLIATAALSTTTHPWLADHAVLGSVLLPGAAFVELALWAAHRTGLTTLGELTLEAPLVLAEATPVQLRLAVEAPGEDGSRAFAVHTRDDAGAWTRHARGVLEPDTPAAPLTGREELGDAAPWPPAGAEPLATDGLYTGLAEAGFSYGPAFQGLRAAWRHGDAVLAEVALPDTAAAHGTSWTLHPALLDAALHTVALGGLLDTTTGSLPFAFTGVRVAGTAPGTLRVRVAPTGKDTVGVELADTTGAPVGTVGSLVLRPLTTEQLSATRRAAGGHALHRQEWAPAPAPASGAPTTWVHLGDAPDDGPSYPGLSALTAALDTGTPAPDAVLLVQDATDDEGRPDPAAPPAGPAPALRALLGLLQEFLAEPRLAAAQLVLVTRGAVAVDDSEPVAPDLAALCGLVRSAQAENPGQLLLVDTDDPATVTRHLPALRRLGAPETALRHGRLHTPRLTRLPAPATTGGAGARPLAGPDGEGTVLVTGATGSLGGLVARHLVTAHGVRRLLLTSRSGPAAPGAAALAGELRALGAHVDLTACDMADHTAVAGLLGAVPAAHPLTAVVHAAGVLDDATVPSLTPAHLDRVLRPKADAARHLHALTRELDLAAFVLFSSAAAPLGAPGQGNYAAANAYLDALARHRTAAGLTGVSLAWGSWAPDGGMAAQLGEGDTRRLNRSGILPLSAQEGLDLFDRALLDPGLPGPAPLPLRTDLAALRAQAATGLVHPLLGTLVPAPDRPAGGATPAAADGAPGELRERLAALPDEERRAETLRLVRTEAAQILGHAGADGIEAGRGFLDMGFDSLTAVELRNRLGALTGVRLPSTLIFDHPAPEALAAHLAESLAAPGEERGAALLAELDRIGSRLATADLDPVVRVGVTARLHSLLARYEQTPEETGSADLATKIDDASDDEIFDFIDNELGAV